MSAEEYSIGDVGTPAVARPVMDMVRLGPTGRTIAVGPAAATIARGQRDALTSCVEALLPAHIDGLAVAGGDLEHRTGAGKSLDGLDRHRVVLALQLSVTGTVGDRFTVDENPHAGSAAPKELRGVGIAARDE